MTRDGETTISQDQAAEGFADRWCVQDAPAAVAIDSHAHVFIQGLPLARERRHTPDYNASVDDYAQQLAANRISHGVLVQPSFLGTDNAFLLAALKRYPSRFRGVVVVEPDIDEAQLEALARLGVVGVRLNLISCALPQLHSPLWQRFMARINALDWHIEVQCQAEDLPYLLGALLDGGCKVVIDHFGRPDPQRAEADPGFQYLLTQGDTGRVWVKLSGAYRCAQMCSDPCGRAFGERAAKLLLQAFSSSRLLWGSDWPHTQHQQWVDYAATTSALLDWVADPCERDQVMMHTPQKLFKFNP
ncbi:amidohydrolase family protein [Pseudomonas rubra]|uniref:Amidohydrolase family protein n=1 Tax=Pseudomonas rubra TaxID=2942627 RepID=A0ABT5P6J6_9PSED|nr:amidohydrolase family protein [Pseudomonas rubra]MDD1013914.1 amidohydrolase family protein [Pseudomonas rubra]MDD1038265.1 amidohydrolase family protein [Pseudomonas rubra]MDD1154645.1 amidohydrolase family protein [Pseudomonas rubra]